MRPAYKATVTTVRMDVNVHQERWAELQKASQHKLNSV